MKFYLFADDTNIYYESKELTSTQHKINRELKKLVTWLDSSRLALNVAKTNFVIFAPRNKPVNNIILLINKRAITQTKYVKYLGVLIDSNLSFSHHISSVSKKISRAVGIMFKINEIVPSYILINLYYSIIYPFLIYGLPIWGGCL